MRCPVGDEKGYFPTPDRCGLPAYTMDQKTGRLIEWHDPASVGFIRSEKIVDGEPWHKWMTKGVLLGIGAGVGTALILWLRGKE